MMASRTSSISIQISCLLQDSLKDLAPYQAQPCVLSLWSVAFPEHLQVQLWQCCHVLLP